MEPYLLNLNLIRKIYNRHAHHYSQYSDVIKHIGHQMLSRLDYIKIDPKRIVDLGASDGFFSKKLAETYPESQILPIDIANKLLPPSKPPILSINSNAYQLPLPAQSIDFIFANLLLPYCMDLEKLITECQRVLTQNGLFLFTTLGPDSFIELAQIFGEMDDAIHIHGFFDMHDIGDVLQKTGFSDPVMDMQKLKIQYSSLEKLHRELKFSGSQNITSGRKTKYITKKNYGLIKNSFNNQENTVSLEIIHGHAWGLGQAQKNTPQLASISVDQLFSSKSAKLSSLP